MKRRIFIPLCASVSLFSLFSAVGCGGSHSSTVPLATTGRATFSVRWPERTRLVPQGANSVKVSFLSGGTEVRSVLLVRPVDATFVTTATVNDLAKGSYTIRASAQASTDGTGNPIATVSSPITISPGQNLTVPLTMASTIASLEITPAVINLTGVPVTLNAVAKDASGAIVLGGTFTWQNSNADVISLVPNGTTATVAAVGAGDATVTLTETESGKTFNKLFTVVPVQ